MRIRFNKEAINILESDLNIFCKTPLEIKKSFNNHQPIHIEVGSGKGKFILTKAIENPKINYFAIELHPTIALYIYKKIIKNNIKNVRIACFDAILLSEYFEKNSIDKMYLNFSDPWPKKKHEKRRLTYIKYLNIYYSILKNNSYIEFKTDNTNLYAYSLSSFANSKFKIIEHTNDLYNNKRMNLDNIKTEYEEKFYKKGYNIKKIIVRKQDNEQK